MTRKSRKDLQRDNDLTKADAKELWHNKRASKTKSKRKHGKFKR
jgi:hypothetical protein